MKIDFELDFQIPIGVQLREIRKSLKLTIAKAGFMVGYSESDLCRLERGIHQPNWKKAAGILTKYHIYKVLFADNKNVTSEEVNARYINT